MEAARARGAGKTPARPLWRGVPGWALVASAGLLAAACLWTTPLPGRLCRLLHRGLRRHGLDLPVNIVDRRGLDTGQQEPAGGRRPVTMSTGRSQLIAALGLPAFRLFLARDRSRDGQLDPREFADLLAVLGPVSMTAPRTARSRRREATSPDKDVLLSAHLEPLDPSSLTKETAGAAARNLGYLESLLEWRRPHRRLSRVSVSDLAELLWPPAARALPVGAPFDLLREERWSTAFQRRHSDSVNRFAPPQSVYRERREAAAVRLLSALHPGAVPVTRYHPRASAAVLRAANEHSVRVLFRLHAEFQLSTPPRFPFWFTPSFLLGEVEFQRDLSAVRHFHMDIPRERRLNVDMEWVQTNALGDPFVTQVEVDIGHVRRMELRLHSPSPNATRPAAWTSAITSDEAFRLVERHLYPFKRVEYAPFGEAFARAAAGRRLVHAVALWGSLDDQSC